MSKSINRTPPKENVSFSCSKLDKEFITSIVDRAWDSPKHNVRHVYSEKMDLMMDITAAHCNGNKLRLRDLLEADDFNFFHDIYGIAKHLNRTTGKLEGWFRPRFLL